MPTPFKPRTIESGNPFTKRFKQSAAPRAELDPERDDPTHAFPPASPAMHAAAPTPAPALTAFSVGNLTLDVVQVREKHQRTLLDQTQQFDAIMNSLYEKFDEYAQSMANAFQQKLAGMQRDFERELALLTQAFEHGQRVQQDLNALRGRIRALCDAVDGG